MTESNSRQPADLLEQAVGALRTTAVPAGPSADLVASTTRALRQEGGAAEQGRHLSRRNRMFRTARLCSIAVAATVLLALGVFVALPGRNSAAQVEVDGTAYRIQGPFTHQDLTVFLLCSNRQDGNDFLTL